AGKHRELLLFRPCGKRRARLCRWKLLVGGARLRQQRGPVGRPWMVRVGKRCRQWPQRTSHWTGGRTGRGLVRRRKIHCCRWRRSAKHRALERDELVRARGWDQRRNFSNRLCGGGGG